MFLWEQFSFLRSSFSSSIICWTPEANYKQGIITVWVYSLGSVLGRMLFKIMSNDVEETIKSWLMKSAGDTDLWIY